MYIRVQWSAKAESEHHLFCSGLAEQRSSFGMLLESILNCDYEMMIGDAAVKITNFTSVTISQIRLLLTTARIYKLYLLILLRLL